jgi:hypothetical protein
MAAGQVVAGEGKRVHGAETHHGPRLSGIFVSRGAQGQKITIINQIEQACSSFSSEDLGDDGLTPTAFRFDVPCAGCAFGDEVSVA